VVYVLEDIVALVPEFASDAVPASARDAPRSADPSCKKLDLHDALSQAAKTLRYQQ